GVGALKMLILDVYDMNNFNITMIKLTCTFH
ncbi:hypothetical protein SS7213T_09759, partial [Staphylococcus simiae CCM 7213 = CCUG 51256]